MSHSLHTAQKPSRRSARLSYRVAPYLFVAPAFVGIILLIVVPALLSFVASLFDIPLGRTIEWEWVGLDNYVRIFSDALVLIAFRNTIVYAAVTIIPGMIIGLLLALALERGTRGQRFARTLLFLPMTANLVAMAVIFRWIFAYQGGFVNQMLGVIGIPSINWLGDTQTSLFAVAVLGIWQTTSLCMLILLSGLTTIPTSIHEAARSDGIRGVRKIVTVVLPMMKPTMVFLTVYTVLQAVQIFDSVNVMTNGGPENSSETVMTATWKIGFKFFELGPASAISFVLVVVLMGVGLLRRRSFGAES